MDRLSSAAEKHLGVVDAVEPSRPFASVLCRRPVLVADRLVEPEDRLEREQTEWGPGSVGAEGERKMPEEALCRRPNQPTKALTLRISREVELRRVVYDQDPLVLDRATSRLTKVRRQNGLGRHAVVPEKTVRSFELRVVERLGKAFARSLRHLIDQKAQTSVESLVAEVGLAQLSRDRRYLCALAGHTRRGSRPRSARKMCRIVRAAT